MTGSINCETAKKEIEDLTQQFVKVDEALLRERECSEQEFALMKKWKGLFQSLFWKISFFLQSEESFYIIIHSKDGDIEIKDSENFSYVDTCRFKAGNRWINFREVQIELLAKA